MRRNDHRECPRCHLIATKADARRNRCPQCGAELVSAHSPTEAWIRAYLYEGGGTHRAPPPATVEHADASAESTVDLGVRGRLAHGH